MEQSMVVGLTPHVEKVLRQRNKWRQRVRARNVNVLGLISDKTLDLTLERSPEMLVRKGNVSLGLVKLLHFNEIINSYLY